MSDDQEASEERPCLHCLIVELIDDFLQRTPWQQMSRIRLIPMK
jgi:hypothetical protein